MREVEERGISVPPAARLGLFLESILPFAGNGHADVGEKATLRWIAAHIVRVASPGDAAERGKVHADVGAHPQHHLVAHCVKLVHHRLRVRKARWLEAPVAVSGLPRVVDHQNARRHAVRDHRLRIRKDVLLVLVVRQLYPRVELRCREEPCVGRLAARREPLAHRMAVHATERRLGSRLDEHRRIGVHREASVLEHDLRLRV